MRKTFFIFLLLLLTLFTVLPKSKGGYKEFSDNMEMLEINPFILDTANFWVDSVFHSLTLRERIGQLMMVSVYSHQGAEHLNQIAQQIEKYNIGGVIFMKGSPVKQALYTNHLQSKAKTPLLVSIDGEWGLSMRLDSIQSFPRQMMLGAIANEGLIYDMGVEIARQCKRLGIHVNFAPVVDINNNPKNPVINSRSFGEDKKQVIRRSFAYMSGMQDNGLLVTAKHFPGHGDTDVDSHYGLPTLNHDRKHLEQNELYPFKHLIQLGLTGIMIAHLHVPSLDPAALVPATLSKEIVTNLLIEKYGFQGLIFTDAMNMGGVAKAYSPDAAALLAFKAGNDIILFPPDLEKAINSIEKAIENKEIDENELNHRCKKILAAKHYVQLNDFKPIEVEKLISDLQTDESQYLNEAIAAEALTVLVNKKRILPIQSTDSELFVVNIDAPKTDHFVNRVKSYSKTKNIRITNQMSLPEKNMVLNQASKYPYIVIAWHGLSQYPSKNYGVTPQIAEFINALAARTKVILTIFGNPYVLTQPVQFEKMDAIIVTYEDTRFTQNYAAQLIFGGIEAKGKLPVTSGNFKAGVGLSTAKTRLGYLHPRMVGANQSKLNEIDDLMHQVIREKITPGAQVLCVKNGYVFYDKNFGYHTYDSLIPVSEESIYDLASLSKILVTTPLMMHMYETKKIKLNQPLGHYLPMNPDKVDLSITDMLAHQARFKAWVPFFKITLDDSLNYKEGFYSTTDTGRFVVPVAKNLFTTPEMADTIFHILDTSPLVKKKEYLYSDMPFYYFMQMIENIENKEIDFLADSLFFQPLGIENLKYYPTRHYSLDRIVPTENDTVFRKQIVHGYVHDQGAALLGGKCGHAGLFGNAAELAKIGQMYLNKGEYGGKNYFEKATVEHFTKAHFLKFNNRRGLGFDKPEPRKKVIGPAFDGISLNSFGHTGFTGTYLWVDPDEQIVYVFLSNRTYPDAKNSKLSKNNIRTRIHKLFYEAFIENVGVVSKK
jgi:beta-glucosidase-like glycosyl hydrolase/CubicO group peptidase (beta-lactamase class C family)